MPQINDPTRWSLGQSVRRRLRNPYLPFGYFRLLSDVVESSWNVMAQGDAWEGKWRGNWRLEWVASTLHTTSEHGVSNITTADAHTSAASSRLNWRPSQFKLTRPFGRKTKSGFCACAITFQTQCTHQTTNPCCSFTTKSDLRLVQTTFICLVLFAECRETVFSKYH